MKKIIKISTRILQLGCYLFPLLCNAQIATGYYATSTTQSLPFFLVSNRSSWHLVTNISGLQPNLNYGNSQLPISCVGKNCVIATGLVNSETGIPVLFASEDNGNSWAVIKNIKSPKDTVKNGMLDTIQCTKQKTCIAMGTDATGFPLFATSFIDDPFAWSYSSPINNFPSNINNIVMTGLSCAGDICSASGSYRFVVNGDLPHPLLLSSQNSGKTWTSNSVPVPQGKLDSISCSADLCVAAGETASSTNETDPFLMVTPNKGVSWFLINSITNLPKNANTDVNIDLLNCSGNNCVAMGKYLTGWNDTALLPLTSHDQGATWSFSTIINNAPHKISEILFHSMQCANNICMVLGENRASVYDPFQAMLLMSTDNGSSWTFENNIQNSLPVGALSFALNTVSYTNNIWSIGGEYTTADNSMKPLLLNSNDNGNSWVIAQNIPVLATDATLQNFS